MLSIEANRIQNISSFSSPSEKSVACQTQDFSFPTCSCILVAAVTTNNEHIIVSYLQIWQVLILQGSFSMPFHLNNFWSQCHRMQVDTEEEYGQGYDNFN